MKVALVRAGMVENVVEVKDDFDGTEWDGMQVVKELPPTIAPGDRYAAGKFTKPEPPKTPRIEELRDKESAFTPAEIQEALRILLGKGDD